MPETLSLPKTLNDRYAIERELGREGFTTLFLARDLAQNRRVTVRVLSLGWAAGDQGERGDRFLKSASTLAQLEHPNILPVVDSGRFRAAGGEEAVYCVLAYVEGQSLRHRLDRDRQLALDETLRIAGDVATGLDYAHRARGSHVGHDSHVAHGDLRPENILLTERGALVDFSAGLWLSTPGLEVMHVEPDNTPRGLSYLSPERLVGGDVIDRQSDQYALAAVMFEMLTGESVFVGAGPNDVYNKVLIEPPRRLTAIRVVPRIVERAINRALAKAPAARFPSVGDFMAALHGASAGRPEAATASGPTPPRRRWRVPVIASVVVLVTAVGVAMASRAVVSRRPASTAAHQQLTFAGTATAPALSPDGRSVMYIAGGRSLVVQPLDGGDPVALVPSARAISVARWSGDGRTIVVAMARDSAERPGTFLVRAECPPQAAGCGAARKVLDDARPFDAGADSTAIVRAPRETGRLEIVSLASGKPTRTIALPDSIGPIAEVAWSPDRRWIAFTDASNGELWVVAAGGGSPSHIADNARRIRWASGTDALYFLGGPAGAVELMRVAVDGQSGRAAGDAARVTSLLAADAFDVGRNNRLVHTQTSPGAQALTFVLGGAAPRRTVEQHALSEGTSRLDGAVVSPDGRWVAYSAARGAERDIHVVAFGGGSARVLATSRAREDAPAWSPDGSRLTFAREDSAGRRLMVADARSGVAQRTGSLPGPAVSDVATAGRWSASGRHIAYYADDLKRIALINLQRRNESTVRVPDYVGRGHFGVVPSPNGTQLLATTADSAEDQRLLWLVFGNGRRWRQIRTPFGETLPVAWHRNGWIYLVRNRGVATDHGAVHVELWRMRGPTGRAELYAALPEGCGMSVSISADATRGVCNYVRVESDLYVASSFGTSAR